MKSLETQSTREAREQKRKRIIGISLLIIMVLSTAGYAFASFQGNREPEPIVTGTQLKVGDRTVRRVIQISEIAGMDEKTGEVLLNDAFIWNPVTDKHVFSGRSIVFEKIGELFGESIEHITYELNKRKTALEWMVRNDIRDRKTVTETILEFYADPERFYERKRYLT